MKITLRAARINKNIKLKDAAVKLEVSADTLRSYEMGKKMPKIDLAFKAACLYGCQINDIDFLCPECSLLAN